MKFSISKCVGRGYNRGWFTNCHCRYRCYKGARNTKKSYVIIGLEVLMKIITDPRRNVLILRNTLKSQRFSTFSTIVKLINQPDIDNPELSLSQYFEIREYNYTIKYKPTGQLIIFSGMDDSQKIQGIRTPVGFLTDVYIEEAFEIEDYEAWRKVDGSIRGVLPEGLFFQITFCFNAWSKEHWLYEHFFKGNLEDDPEYLETHMYADFLDENYVGDFGQGLYLHISTFRINEFRDRNWDISMAKLKEVAPEIYKVEALGCWGNASEQTYPEFSDDLIITPQAANSMPYVQYGIGIDTGLSNGEGKVIPNRCKSATTMQFVGLTADYNKLVSIDEYFYSNEKQTVKKTEPELMEDIVNTLIEWKKKYQNHPVLMKGTIPVYVDCADIGFRQGLELVASKKGLFNVRFLPSTKIPIRTRVDLVRLLMAWSEFLISSNCKNLIREIKNSRKGEGTQVREDFDDHAINSNEYGWQPLAQRLKRWKTFKQH